MLIIYKELKMDISIKIIQYNKLYMNINIINKILGVKLPDDIIRVIASYFIQKISKKDARSRCIEHLLNDRNYNYKEGFYSTGEFRYKIVFPKGRNKGIFFILQTVPELFIEYIFGIFEYNEISSGTSIFERERAIRFWIKEDKCEIAVNGQWVEKV